jgi:hypothetical protein
LRAARAAAAALGRIDDDRALAALAGALNRPELTSYALAGMLERVRRLARPEEWSAAAAALTRALHESQTPAQTQAIQGAQAAIAPFITAPSPPAAANSGDTPGPTTVDGGADRARAAAAPAPDSISTEHRDAPVTTTTAPVRASGAPAAATQALLSAAAAHPPQPGSSAAVSRDAQTLAAAVQQLKTATPEATPERLRELSIALVRFGTTPALTPALRDELLALLRERVADPEPSTAAYALDSLRALRDPRAAIVIALLLRTGSASRRAAAVCALADFPHTDTRRLLRFLIQNEGPPIAECAALALAEVGDERDAGALLRVAERGAWPLPAAVSYALTRIAQRGVTRKHTLERVLCELNEHPDRYVRANVAAGLALLGAEPCDSHASASSELDPDVPSALRVARAHFWRSYTPRDAATDRALAQCSGSRDPEVAQACAGIGVVEEPATDGGKLDVYAFGPDGTTVLREQVVALRLANGSVFVGRTDANGHVLLPAAVGGEVVLEDAADAAPLRNSPPAH